MNPRDVQPMMIALITFLAAIALTNICVCILNAICYSTKFIDDIWGLLKNKDQIIQIKNELLATSVLSALQVLYCIILGFLLYCLGEKFCLHITAAVLAVFTLIGIIILLSFSVDHTKISNRNKIEDSLKSVVYDPSLLTDDIKEWREKHKCTTAPTNYCDNEINLYVTKNIKDIRVMNLVTLILIILIITGIIISCLLMATIKPKKTIHQEAVQPFDGIDDSDSDNLDRLSGQREQTDAEKTRNREQ